MRGENGKLGGAEFFANFTAVNIRLRKGPSPSADGLRYLLPDAKSAADYAGRHRRLTRFISQEENLPAFSCRGCGLLKGPEMREELRRASAATEAG